MSTDVLVMKEGTASEMLLARQCLAVLMKHYPGYQWTVEVRADQGIIEVLNMDLSGKWGFMLHLVNVQEDAKLSAVMRAGGELLERYRLRRGGASQERLAEMPTDFSGNHIPDKD